MTPPSPIYQENEEDREEPPPSYTRPPPSYTRCESGKFVKIQETAPGYTETPKRRDIRSRLGPRRVASVKDRLGSPSIKSRLGQKNETHTRRENPWNRWEQTSPWSPWKPGEEPKCDFEWNRQMKEHLSNILTNQEAENQDKDELGSVSSTDEEEEK